MITFFQILIVFGVIFFGVIIVIVIKTIIEDINSPNQGRNEIFLEWLKTKESGETFAEWKRKNNYE